MNRLFTFGCSLTQYWWPTWADILGRQFDYFENWGKSGAGNHFIFNSVIECNLRNSFTKDDTIGIMWTNVAREDRYIKEWYTPGNMFTTPAYDPKWLKQNVSVRGLYIRDLAYISAIKNILDNLSCRYFFLSMCDIDTFENYGKATVYDEVKDILDLHRNSLEIIKPSIHKTIFNYKWKTLSNGDIHPLPSNHIKYLESVTDYTFTDFDKQWAKDQDEIYKNITKESLWRTNPFPQRF